ncbi:MAG TPA: lantibiotic dehydratase [Chitinophaga sp.]|uniref:lantibiotic dehydratase n=1 Tax=Chitinophaga sp. TaxID=1869181 RepID=UPI002C3DC6F9|nr:lantibiotic dehydratase [Chitinophaga sp.]HVI46001.1 lantibiotic dehydratase [Chitinophaga sp.]
MNLPYAFDHRLVLRTPRYPLSDAAAGIDFPALLNDQVFLEALYLASPVLYDECIKWKEGSITAKKDIDKLTRTLCKYYVRMNSRCTPFGLFSGCAVTGWNDGPTAVTVSNSRISRHTRLDMHYLCALSQKLALMPAIKRQLLYFPNSSVYTIGDELRYVEYTYANGRRIHQISSAGTSVYLDQVVNAAYNGITIPQLCELLVQDDITEEEVLLFVDELIHAQVLVSELEPAITGKEFLQQITEVLQRINSEDEEISTILYTLRETEQLLHAIDAGDGNDVARYRHIMSLLDKLGVTYDESKLFQTDVVKDVNGAGVSSSLQNRLTDVLDVLNKLGSLRPNANLQSFIRRFNDRYEDKEMPLLEVLDTETGIGYVENSGNRIAPLVDDLAVKGKSKDAKIGWGKLERMLHEKLQQAYVSGGQQIEITDADLVDFKSDWNNMPPSFSVMFRLVDDSNDNIFLESVGGSSAANLLGRFAHADEEVNQLVCDITRQEQEKNADVVFAEVIHLPESRTGNILLHPVFRGYEIPYLAKSSLDKEQQIDLQDIYVSIRNNRIVLRSRRLNKKIITRLSSAHNYSYNSLPVYRFLCDLQLQGKRPGLVFQWGGLQQQYEFLPRVTYKGVILHMAHWGLLQDDVKHLTALDDTALAAALPAFREQWKLPVQVVLTDGDNELLVDFNNVTMVRAWLDTVKGRSNFVLREFINNQRLVTDESGQPYVNQFIAVLVKEGASYAATRSLRPADQYQAAIQRHFIPGSEWVYYKLYCGVKSADKILSRAIAPLSEELEAAGYTDKWFFIRYTDPEYHIRLRFHVKDVQYIKLVMERIYASLLPFKDAGYIWKMQMDTYNRELERYGSHTIEHAETFFYHDSKALTGMLANTAGDEREHIRWLWALRSVDELLDSFAFQAAEKLQLLTVLRDSFAAEFNHDKSLKIQLDTKYRNYRKKVEQILDREQDNLHGLYPLMTVLEERAAGIESIAAALKELHVQGRLQVPITGLLSSYIHMIINRIAITDSRKQELVIYDFLARYYQSSLARAKARAVAEL